MSGSDAVGNGCGNGFLQQFHMLESSEPCGLHRGCFLRGVELSWHGNDDASAIVNACVGSQRLNDFGGELLGGEVLLEVLAAIELQRAHGTLELKEDIGGCGAFVPCLRGSEGLAGQFVGGSVAGVYDTLACYGHDGGECVLLCAALLDHGYAVFHNADCRVGRAEVYSSVDLTVIVHL